MRAVYLVCHGLLDILGFILHGASCIASLVLDLGSKALQVREGTLRMTCLAVILRCSMSSIAPQPDVRADLELQSSVIPENNISVMPYF